MNKELDLLQKLTEELAQYEDGSYTAKMIYDYVTSHYTPKSDTDKMYTEDHMLLAFVHGGTKAEENKDAKKLAENFKDVMKILNREE